MLVISDGPGFDFGTLATNTTSNHLFVVTNSGTASATSMGSTLAAPFAYLGGSYPGAGGTCNQTLGAGASCFLDVAFSPASPAAATATLSIAYFDGTASATAKRDLSGAGTSRAFLSFTDYPLAYYQQYGLQTDPPTFAFGARGVGSKTTATFYLTNTGAAGATSLSGGALAAPFTFAGGSYPGSGGSCAGALAAGDSCSVVVVFGPASPTASTDTLSVNYNDGSGAASATRPLAGSGTSEPVLTVQDFNGINLQAAAWDFGTIGVGGSATHEFFVTNTGGATASALSPVAIGTGFGYLGGSYPGTGGTCSTSLAAGRSCTVEVQFQPAAPGLTAGTVTLAYQDASANSFSASRIVRGIGTASGLIQIIDSSGHGPALLTDFGVIALGGGADRTLTLQNIGGGAVSGMSLAAFVLPFSLSGGTCTTSLAMGASCLVAIHFAPTAVGDSLAALAVSYNDGSATQSVSRTLAGHAVDGARLTISDWSNGGDNGGDPFDFGSWGIATTHTFYLTNSGNKVAASLAAGALAAPFSFAGGYPGGGGTCGPSLAAGATCTLVVTYSGASTAGGQLSVAYGDGDGNTLTAARQMVGEAVANAMLVIGDCFNCGIDNSPFDFGSTSTSATRTFSLQNDGAKTAAMIQDGAGLGGAFAYAGGSYPGVGGDCTTTLASGASCSLVVIFTPPSVGNFTGTLSINYDDGTGTPATATRGLLGAETNLALLTVHDYSATDSGGGDVFDFGVTGVAVDHAFTLTNDGSQAATLIADGGGLGNGFAWKGGTYPGTTGTCGISLAPNGQCTVVVAFSPSGNQTRSSSLIVSYFNGANVSYTTRALQATATTAALLQVNDFSGAPSSPNGSDNPLPYDFGTSGTPIDHVFSLTNWGGSTATMITDGGTLGGRFGWTGGGAFGGGSCGAQLAPGATCTVSVTFAPSGNGPATSTLTIAYAAGATTAHATRALTGTATTHAIVNVYDFFGPDGGGPSLNNRTPFDYHVWGVATDYQFTVRNDGGGPATMLASGGAMGTGFAWQGGAFPGTNGNCLTTLAAGATCTAVVTFSPSGTTSLYGQLKVAYSDGGTPATATRAVTGTPTARANLTVSEFPGPNNCTNCGPYGFATVAVGGTMEQTFTVYNTGALTATGLGPTAGLASPFGYKGTSGYPGNGGSCGPTLAPNSQCQLVVVFAPQSPSTASATLAVAYDDTFTSPLIASRALTGTGD